jgi:hypothetical protein
MSTSPASTADPSNGRTTRHVRPRPLQPYSSGAATRSNGRTRPHDAAQHVCSTDTPTPVPPVQFGGDRGPVQLAGDAVLVTSVSGGL